MPFYRVYMLFNRSSAPLAGYSERMDVEANNDAQARTRAAIIVGARLRLLSGSWSIVGVRLASLELGTLSQAGKIVARNVYLCPEIPGGEGQLGIGDVPAAAVFWKIKWMLIRRASNMQLRGIPDSWWNLNQLTTADNYIQAYCQSLKAASARRVFISGEPPNINGTELDCCRTVRISSRRVGRPFGLLRGRQSKVPG